MNVGGGSRWVGNRNKCIRANGALAHPSFEIGDARGRFVFRRLPLLIEILGFGIVVSFECFRVIPCGFQS